MTSNDTNCPNIEELRKIKEKEKINKENKRIIFLSNYRQEKIKQIDDNYMHLYIFANDGRNERIIHNKIIDNERKWANYETNRDKCNILKEIANSNKYQVPLVYEETGWFNFEKCSLKFKW